VVLWLPVIAHAACLACTWIEDCRSDDFRSAGRAARRHCVERGGDPTIADRLPVRISERHGPNDEPLRQAWV